MEDEILFPEPFYITGIPKSSERAKLFRPKELRDFVFPEIGMIMYPLFWVKYTLYLIKKGYDLSKQKYLFFWGQKNKIREPLDGVLYYSLLSRFLNQESDIIDVSVGKRWAKWIFKNNWNDKIINEIKKITRNPEDFNYTKFADIIFSSDFKTDCSRLKIDLSSQIKLEMSDKYSPSKEKNYNEDVKNVISIFVKSLANILVSNKDLDIEEGSVIKPNIDFTTKILINKKEDLKDLSILANNNFNFTPEELKKLIDVLQKTEKGRYFIRSFLLISYFDPVNHNNEYIKEKLRDIYYIYFKMDDFKEKLLKKFSRIKFDHRVFEELEKSCFYWELNYFLADGEDIARDLLEKNRGFISEKVIEEYFSKSKSYEVEKFLEFIKNLENENRKIILKEFIEKLINENQENIANFLEILFEGIRKNSAAKTFLDLLVDQNSLEKEAESLYSVVEFPKKLSSAFFYGIDPLIDWSRTILTGLNNE